MTEIEIGRAKRGRQAYAFDHIAIVPSRLRGNTEQMSRARQVIAKRMVESLHVSAQLTTVVEVDITRIARLRAQAKDDFERRDGLDDGFDFF